MIILHPSKQSSDKLVAIKKYADTVDICGYLVINIYQCLPPVARHTKKALAAAMPMAGWAQFPKIS